MAPETRIVRPLPCLACGYSLQGLKLSDRCPECGAAAQDSLEHLALVNQPALARLRWGATLVAISSAAVAVLYVAAGAAMLVLTGAGLSNRSAAEDAVLVFIAVVCMAAPAVGCLGWLLLAGVERIPGAGGEPSLAMLKRWALALRVLAITFATLAVIGVIVAATGSSLGRAPDMIPIAIALLASCWSLRNLYGLRLLEEIARRAGVARLARAARLWRFVNGFNAAILLLDGIVLYPVMLSLNGYTVIERRIGWSAAMIAMCAAALLVFTTAANFVMGLWIRIVLGRLLRSRAADLGPVFEQIPETGPQTVVLTPPRGSERIGP